MTKVNPDRTSLLEALAAGPAKIRFLKTDGQDRTMNCTRSMPLVPADLQPKNSESFGDPDFVPVYDLDLGAWRGFKISRLISATVEA
jgi:hypothetical protein